VSAASILQESPALNAQSSRLARKVSDQKRTGAHFTPPDLADFVAQRITAHLTFSKEQLEVLDPSCGDGELLRAFWASIPAQYQEHVTLRGIEDHEPSLKAAEGRLAGLGARSKFIHADFITTTQRFRTPQLFASNGGIRNVETTLPQPRVIIANPPYVRTQILGADRAQDLARQFGLYGRVDLYHVFLIAMAEVLQPGGLMGVITSNRFLTTRGGEALRQELAARFELLEIIDLGDTKMFTAAVLPAVIIAKKRSVAQVQKSPQTTRFIRVYEHRKEDCAQESVAASSILKTVNFGQDGQYTVDQRIFNVTSGQMTIDTSPRDAWRMATANEAEWMSRIDQSTRFRVADLAKVRVGIKTTADSVFIKRDWALLAKTSRPEKAILRPLLTHHDAARWTSLTSSDNLAQIAYPHESVNGKRQTINLEQYPRAKSYFESNRRVLENRTYVTRSGRKWYEIWVPQDPAAWGNPKIVFPDISVEPRFFFDGTGALVNGDCYWISLDPAHVDILLLIQGVANSALMLKYHDLAFNNRLYSGRRRFISQYVERYPIPDPTSKGARAIIKIVKQLNRHPSADLEQKLNRTVEFAFGFRAG